MELDYINFMNYTILSNDSSRNPQLSSPHSYQKSTAEAVPLWWWS